VQPEVATILPSTPDNAEDTVRRQLAENRGSGTGSATNVNDRIRDSSDTNIRCAINLIEEATLRRYNGDIAGEIEVSARNPAKQGVTGLNVVPGVLAFILALSENVVVGSWLDSSYEGRPEVWPSTNG